MIKLLNTLSLICIVLTVVGLFIVIFSGGATNPAVAIIPMVISIVCNNIVKAMRKQK